MGEKQAFWYHSSKTKHLKHKEEKREDGKEQGSSSWRNRIHRKKNSEGKFRTRT
jgi:hypothetical protein